MSKSETRETLRPAAVPGAIMMSVLSASLIPSTAHAEMAAADNDRQIVVSGQRVSDANPDADPDAPYRVERSSNGRMTEEVRDTPRSVTIIPKEVIEDIGAQSFRDVVRSTPGVTLGTGEGGNAFGDRIFIRGFEARNDVYIDGMRDPGVSSREIFGVEQVEIVRGPSSFLGGRGTTGGAVSLQSKAPLENDFIIGQASIGTEDLYRGTIDINQNIAEGFAVRLNGLYHNADTPGRDYVGSERYGIAAALSWQPAPGLEIAADYYHFRLDGMSDYGHPFDIDSQGPVDVDADNFYGVVGRDFLENGSDIGTVTIRYTPNDQIDLRSMWRYGEVYNRYIVSAPRAPCRFALNPDNSCSNAGPELPIDQWTVAVGAPQRNARTRYYATINDATLNVSTGGIDHTIVAGFEYANERIGNRRYAIPDFVEDGNGNQFDTSTSFVRNLLNPDPVLGFTIPHLLDPTPATTTDIESMGVYLIDTLKFSPQWEALVGIRYDTYDIDQFLPARIFRGTALPEQRLGNTVDFLNYQAALVFKPVEPLTIYASFSTSSNPSGEQLDSTSSSYGGLAPETASLDPERNTAFEIGIKYEPNDDLLLTAALFHITKDNAREQTAPGIFELVGEQRSQGFEISATGNPLPGVSVFAGYAFVDAEITDSPDPVNVGVRFANIPRHSGNILVTFEPVSGFQFGGQAYAQSRIYGGTIGAGDASVPGYVRFDAVARYRITEQVELRLNVLNLTDERYYDAIYRSGTPFSYVAPGRSAFLTLTAGF
ncbi:TonB-dependent receptor [Parasphingopyxis marina]|uniref:TonB-dependent receptor n=1 Tax=Parasphingopyxis marina TaxID=2761622 RepID=A0A842HUN3_9SPHN|nr:TonB-dependent receptor [Parasphingopyxis marina]MBC2776712.1 TonB-dependent receptor [Parasphingopyxis marina]